MSRSQAVRSGFSAVVRRPALFAAELAWRWTFGAAALLLIAYSILLFLASTPVSDRDLFGLSGIIPGTTRAALAHIFGGSGPLIVRLIGTLTIGLGLLWWLASALGRAAVLQALVSQSKRPATAALAVLLQFNLLRTIISTFAILAVVGCIALASHAAMTTQSGADQIRNARPDLGAFYVVLLPLALVVLWLWSALNWYLIVAPLIALQNGCGALDSLIKTSGLVLKQFRQFFWVGFAFGVLRLLFAGIFLSFALSVFGVLVQFSTGLAMTGVFLVLLAYFAGADFLAIARIAAYARILEWDSESPRVNATDEKSAVVDLDHPAAEPI